MDKGDDIVERVARALCEADHIDPDADRRVVGNIMADAHLEDPRNCASYQYRKRARAAIGAMREPTGAMVDAGVDSSTIEHGQVFSIVRPWRAMIDAALGVKP